MNISKAIVSFYLQIAGDEFHRYRSWEHCYSYFQETEKKDLEIGALQLAFYLASWGMYRGSSFLLWKDYRIHSELVDKMYDKRLIKHDYLVKNDESNANDVLSQVKEIQKAYEGRITLVNGQPKTVRVSNTLSTKIILGINGLAPAFDRYFIDGLKMSKRFQSSMLSVQTLKEIYRFYRDNHDEFEKASQYIKDESGIDYPPMKLVDMYFWQIGYKNNNN